MKPNKISYKNQKPIEISCKSALIFSSIYLLLYSFLPINPNYGNHASTASNVGRDHRVLFAVWGLCIGLTVFINILYALKKYGCKSKFPKCCIYTGMLGIIGAIMIPNDKYQKFIIHIDRANYKKVTDDIQALVDSREVREIILTKKTFHTAFSIMFGVGFALAILFLLLSKSKGNSIFMFAGIGFIVYMLLSAAILGIWLSGLAEAIIIVIAFGYIYMVNFSKLFSKFSVESLGKYVEVADDRVGEKV